MDGRCLCDLLFCWQEAEDGELGSEGGVAWFSPYCPQPQPHGQKWNVSGLVATLHSMLTSCWKKVTPSLKITPGKLTSAVPLSDPSHRFLNPALLGPSGESWLLRSPLGREQGVSEASSNACGGSVGFWPRPSLWLPLPSRPVCCGTLPEAKEQDTQREK